jgi:hypothetical protein
MAAMAKDFDAAGVRGLYQHLQRSGNQAAWAERLRVHR